MRGASNDGLAPTLETLVVAGLFLALGLAGIANHEMWRDELEIWLIARDSGSLGQLFHNMSTEGHPAVWYLLNFLLTRFTTNPVAMQLLNLAIGTMVAALFFRRAPFTMAQRLLFCFGYFALYEFTVISRSYALGLLLAFAFCVRFQQERRLDPVGAVILFVLANTTLYGTIIAAHVVLLLVVQAFYDRSPGPRWRDRQVLSALIIVLVGVSVGFAHTWAQARSIGPAHAGAYAPEHDLTWIADCLSTIYRGAVPLPDVTQVQSWNTNLLDIVPGSWGAYLGAVLTLLLLTVGARALRRKPALSIVFLVGAATMLSITFFVWYGSVRHHGQVFLWFLVCCWLWYGLDTGNVDDESARAGRGRTGVVLTVLLVVQILAGAYAFVADLMLPFSNAKAVGLHLRRGDFEDVTLVGSIDYAVQPIAAFVDRQFYYPESGDSRTFLDWGPSRKIVSPDAVLRDSLELLKTDRRDVVIVFSYRPGTMQPGQSMRLGPDANLECFARFVGAIVPDENYHLCRLYDTRGGPARDDVDSPNDRTDNYERDAKRH